jgi:tetratricopeptide (TPR) repeat protein
MRVTWPLFRLVALAVLFSWLAPAVAAEDKADEAAREQALQLNDITGSDALTGKIIALLEDKPKTTKLLAAALKLAKEKEKTKEQPFNVNATWILARAAAGLKSFDTAEYFYRQHANQALQLGSSQKFVRGYTALIDLLLANKKYTEAEKVCREFLESGDEGVKRYKILVLRRLVQTQSRMGKGDEALKMVDNLIKAQPSNWLMLELRGWVLRDQNKFAEAAKAYEELLETVLKDKERDKKVREEFADDVRYALSGVYVDLNQIDKAAKYLKELMTKNPKNPTYCNDLGFIWADHDMHLEESEKLIRKALELDKEERKAAGLKGELDKDNAAYLDSLGWVLYKRKKYKEALTPLEQAVKQDEGQHMEIYDHLGDVYLALGEKPKAVAAWKKGLTCAPVSKRDQKRKGELEEKIKKHDKAE